MKYQKAQFDNSLSLHKGWLELFEQARDKRHLAATEQLIRINDDQRLHLHDLRNEIYRLAEVSDDALFAIHCAQEVSPLTFGSFTLAFWTAPNLDCALQQVQDYSIVMSSPVRVEYHKDKHGHGELWILHSEALNKENHTTYMGLIMLMATLLKMVKTLVADQSMTIDVELVSNHLGAQRLAEIEQVTQTNISIGHPIQKLRIDKRFLYRTNRHHEHEIHFSTLNLLRNQAETLKENDVILQIYNTLNQFDDLSNVSAQTISAAMNLNVRTLNRRLSDLNSSYRGVIDKYKLEKALHLLTNPNINMTEIAFQLGFADLSTFSRAFKRWTGSSPIELKAKLSNGQ